MHYRKTEAIVINSTDYGESDRIVTFYTRDFGRIKGIAKGAKRSKRRFPNTLEPFSYIKTEIAQRRDSGLWWIHYCILIEGFCKIHKEIERFLYGSLFLEMIEKFTGEGHPIPYLFPFIVEYIKNMDDGSKPESLTSVFALRLLSMLGYSPYVFGCVICKQPLPEAKDLVFSYKEGGVVCCSCKDGKGEGSNISTGLIRSVRHALTAPVDALSRLSLNLEQQKESIQMLKGFIKYHLDKELKSWSLIKQLKIVD